MVAPALAKKRLLLAVLVLVLVAGSVVISGRRKTEVVAQFQRYAESSGFADFLENTQLSLGDGTATVKDRVAEYLGSSQVVDPLDEPPLLADDDPDLGEIDPEMADADSAGSDGSGPVSEALGLFSGEAAAISNDGEGPEGGLVQGSRPAVNGETGLAKLPTGAHKDPDSSGEDPDSSGEDPNSSSEDPNSPNRDPKDPSKKQGLGHKPPGLPGSALTAPQSVAVVPEPAYPEIAGPSPQTAAGHVAFRFYSHNVKNGLHDDLVPGEMPWDMRKRLVINSIKFNAVANSVVFLQEPLKFQLDDILADLNYLSAPGTPEWVAVGSGRVDGKDVGEHVPILFRPAEWTVVFNDTFWLNDGATRRAVAGWDAKYPRIATYATLKHALSGHHINVANTHFDHKGKTARRESALLLVAKLRSLNLWPLFVMGDLNSQPGDASHREMTKAFVDVHDHVPDFSRYGHLDYTVTGFSGKYLKDAKRIDYIFAPKDTRRLSEPMCADPALPYSLQVVGYGLLHSKFGGVYMSDHRPVVADFVMKGCGLGQATDA